MPHRYVRVDFDIFQKFHFLKKLLSRLTLLLNAIAFFWCPELGDIKLVSNPAILCTEDQARFYAAEVLSSLEYLHLMGFIYRGRCIHSIGGFVNRQLQISSLKIFCCIPVVILCWQTSTCLRPLRHPSLYALRRAALKVLPLSLRSLIWSPTGAWHPFHNSKSGFILILRL